MVNLVPRDYFGVPTFADVENDLLTFSKMQGGNVSISEDDKNVYVDAALPGINPEDIDVTFDHGKLWIRGESHQEEKEKKKKFYRKASESYAYQIVVPGDINQNTEPEASCSNGMVTVVFPKMSQKTPKKISVKSKGIGKKKEIGAEEK